MNRLAALPGGQLPALDARRLLPARRRLRIPRSAAGRHGAARARGRIWRASTCSAPPAASSSKGTCSTGGTSRPAAGCAPAVPTTCSGCRTSPPSTCARPAMPAVLDERVPFLEAPLLTADEHESYGLPVDRPRRRHAVRALPPRDRSRHDRRRARAAALRRRRLERRDEPGRARGARREHVARLLSLRGAARLRAALRRARRGTAGGALSRPGAPAGDRSSNWPGTASGIAAATTTTDRRWARRRTTSAGSTRSRNRGRCSRTPCRYRFAERAMDAVRARADRARIAARPPARSALRSLGAGPRLHQGLSAGRPRKRRPVHACGGLGGDGAGPARQRRRGRRAVPHAQPDQPHPHAGRRRSDTRPSPT